MQSGGEGGSNGPFILFEFRRTVGFLVDGVRGIGLTKNDHALPFAGNVELLRQSLKRPSHQFHTDLHRS